MDAKWEKFDNTLSDLWNFFIPPILNAVVVLVVFQDIPKLIWDSIGFLIIKLRAAANTEVISLPELLNQFSTNSALFSTLSGSAVSAVISGIVTLAILIFVLHKVILISSRIFCGQIDLSEETLNTHPKIAGALVKLRAFLPEEDTYNSVSRGWAYARTVNDKHESLSIYRGKRSKIITEIEKNRSFATYASAYFLLSVISLACFNFSLIPFVMLLVTVVLFLLFSRRYVDACASLADLDIYTFLTLVHYEGYNKNTNTPSDNGVVEKPYFTDHIELFKGNIFSSIIDLLKSRGK